MTCFIHCRQMFLYRLAMLIQWCVFTLSTLFPLLNYSFVSAVTDAETAKSATEKLSNLYRALQTQCKECDEATVIQWIANYKQQQLTGVPLPSGITMKLGSPKASWYLGKRTVPGSRAPAIINVKQSAPKASWYLGKRSDPSILQPATTTTETATNRFLDTNTVTNPVIVVSDKRSPATVADCTTKKTVLLQLRCLYSVAELLDPDSIDDYILTDKNVIVDKNIIPETGRRNNKTRDDAIYKWRPSPAISWHLG